MKVRIRGNDKDDKTEKKGHKARTDSHRGQSTDAACIFRELPVGKTFVIPTYINPGYIMIKLPEVSPTGETRTCNTLCLPPDGEAYLIWVSGHLMVEPKK